MKKSFIIAIVMLISGFRPLWAQSLAEAPNWCEEAQRNLLDHSGKPINCASVQNMRCIRINNYWCQKHGKTAWRGTPQPNGSDGLQDKDGHAIFKSVEWSARAIARDLRSKYRQGKKTAVEIAESHSPWCDTLGSLGIVKGTGRTCADGRAKPPDDFAGPFCRQPSTITPTSIDCKPGCNCPPEIAQTLVRGLNIGINDDLQLFDSKEKPGPNLAVIMKNLAFQEQGIRVSDAVIVRGIERLKECAAFDCSATEHGEANMAVNSADVKSVIDEMENSHKNCSRKPPNTSPDKAWRYMEELEGVKSPQLPNWDGFDTRQFSYSGGEQPNGAKATVITIPLTNEQVARWIVDAVVFVRKRFDITDARRLLFDWYGSGTHICVQNDKLSFIQQSGLQFPVRGVVYEDGLPYPFFDGIAVFPNGYRDLNEIKNSKKSPTSEEQKLALCLNCKEPPPLGVDRPKKGMLGIGDKSRIASTTRQDWLEYQKKIGFSVDMGDLVGEKFIKIVREEFQAALRAHKDRNNLIRAKALKILK
jgi:hypothetical protein